ncbi:IPT/TIG domain protein [Burkholderia pseudomallei]|uniref:IPT/TIG domain-containing protein n=1 Tax=Burkholderia pseudomallei TaxID=28450 RepID=UPI00293C8131|nr:IPT/TIG domain protein [Burkholderia pseudomallei]
MESLGKRQVRDGRDGSGVKERFRRRLDQWFRANLIGLFCLLLLAGGIAHAQSAGYVYDASGRVVATMQSNGSSAQYTYDALGNLIQTTSVPTGQLAIFAFAPTHGVAGTQVVIQGQGFGSASANNTVSFNGVVANVIAASSTQLVVAVPSGATTGAISIAANGQSANSAAPFVIDDTGAPPTIVQVNPAIASIGTTVTVAGTHLDPVDGYTSVQMGNVPISSLASINDSQLQYAVPANAISGYVTVETPYGKATSSSPVTVLPSGISPGSVASSGYAVVNGAAINLNIGAASQYGVMTFDATAGAWLSLQASGIATTANTIHYIIYAPGNSIVQQGTVSSSSPTIHVPQLKGGTYLAVFQPDTASAQLSIGIETNSTLAINAATTVTTPVASQSKRLLFQASAGQTVTLLAQSTSTSPAGQAVSYTVYSPTQQTVITGSITSVGTINMINLPTSGVYQVIVAPGSGVTGAVQLDLVSGDVLMANQQITHHSGYAAGQAATMTFSANAGDNLEVTFPGMSTDGHAIINVFAPNGTNVLSATDCQNGWDCRYSLWNLVSGTYTIVVAPSNSASSVSFGAMLAPDIVGPALSLSSPTTVSLNTGQGERLTFNANAGDNLALSVTNVNAIWIGVYVYRPDASSIAIGNAYTSLTGHSAGIIRLPNLPVSGTYTVVVVTNGDAGSAQFTLAREVLPVDGQSHTYNGYAAGQAATMTFSANAGDNLELLFNHMSAGGHANLNVFAPNGTNVLSASDCQDSWTCRYSLWNLVSGTYTIVVAPSSSGASVSFDAMLTPDIVGPALNLSTPTTVSLNWGQAERLTFNANAGDNLALSVSNVNARWIGVSVYRPDAASIAPGNAYATQQFSGSGTLQLSNLPVSGTYTVVVLTNGEPGSAQLTVAPEVLPADGQWHNYSGYASGQAAVMTMPTNAGDNLELTFNHMSAGGHANLNVYAPNGTNVFSASDCQDSWTCRYSLWNLVGGNYTIVVSPSSSGASVSFDAMLTPDIVGPALSLSTPTAVSLNWGQAERLTFNANAGDNLALSVSNVNARWIGVNVYRPDAASIAPGNAYATQQFSGSGTLQLSNLPVSGTYTVVMYTNGEPGSAQITVAPQ